MAQTGTDGGRRIDEDVFCGIALILFAAFVLYVARGYPVGRAEEMGPGYFPRALGVLLGALGAALAGRALLKREPERASEDTLGWRPILAVSLAYIVFGLTLATIGLLPAVALLSLIACYAIPERRPIELLAIVGAMVGMALALWYVVRISAPLHFWG